MPHAVELEVVGGGASQFLLHISVAQRKSFSTKKNEGQNSPWAQRYGVTKFAHKVKTGDNDYGRYFSLASQLRRGVVWRSNYAAA